MILKFVLKIFLLMNDSSRRNLPMIISVITSFHTTLLSRKLNYEERAQLRRVMEHKEVKNFLVHDKVQVV